MHHNGNHSHAVDKLRELMKDVRICMFTTVDEDGSLHSRPMALQEAEFDGDLWFFTGKSSAKVHEIDREQHVNVAFSKPEDNVYVSVSGIAREVHDRAKAKELWNPFYKTWFPKGLDDPELTLLRVDVNRAEYWDAPNGIVTHLYGVVKATLTGRPPDPGDHEKLSL
jgi:general stress protein 26